MITGIAAAQPAALSTSRAAVTARHALVAAIVLGAFADTALRSAPDGLGWTAWVVALAGAAVSVARRSGVGINAEQALWLLAAVVCAGAFAWRDADDLRAANVLGTLVAIAMFAMSSAKLPSESIFFARVRDVILGGLYAIRDVIAGAPMIVARDAELHTLPLVRGGTSGTAVRALLLTAPLVLVFTVLLSRADPVFASLFEVPRVNVERIAEHVFVAGVFAWWSAGWMRGALLGVARRATLPEQVPLRIGLVEITTALGAVIVLFSMFVVLQVRWLFGGADVVLATTGLTVAEYARRGFFELVAVAALVCPLILVTRAAIDDEQVVRRHRRLSLSLIALLAAIMASALLRMRLYVDNFGLSTDRLYATAMIAWLGVVFIAMTLTVLRGSGRSFAAAAVLSGFATLFALNAINPHQLTARVNLDRASNGARVVDYGYLAQLGGDATPMVVDALNAAPPSADACKAAKALRWRWVRDQEASWNLGAWRGRQSVAENLSATNVLRVCTGATPGS